MKELQRKQRIKRLFYSIPSLVLLTIIMALLAKGAFGIMTIERQNAGKVRDLEREAESLYDREQDLKTQNTLLQTEEGIIEEIKRKFNVTRSGESVAIIVDPKLEATSASSYGGNWLKSLWSRFSSLW